MGWPNKTINRSEENIKEETVSFKEGKRQNGIQKKHSISQKQSQKKTQNFLGQIVTGLKHKAYWTQPKVYTNFRTNKQGYKGNSENPRKQRW